MLLTDYLKIGAEQHPDKLVLIHGARSFTYGEVHKAAMGVAAGLLDFGMEPGFRGALLNDDPFDYIA